MAVPANFTQLLTDWRSGRPEALERLTPLIYGELRRLARSHMRTERSSHTLQATAVVHEAFLRLVEANVQLQDRQHFFALASRLMRRVLVDYAKSRTRLKRSRRTDPGFAGQAPPETPQLEFDIVSLNDALERLQDFQPHLAHLIELHYFGGMSYAEIAAGVGSSAATVHRNVRLGRAWLLNELSDAPT